jgi:hypothetical protein
MIYYCSHHYIVNILFLIAEVSTEDETMGPIFIKEPPNRVDFSNGTGAVIECQARGNPQPDIIWVRADGTAVGDVPGLRQVCCCFNILLRIRIQKVSHIHQIQLFCENIVGTYK